MPVSSALFTDLYEVTMAQAYAVERLHGVAVFETFFRKLPSGRSYVMAAGLWDVLGHLESLRFEDDEIDYLRELRLFSGEFLEQLRGLRFNGDVWAVPEGTIVFPNEPIVQIIAPLIEAQLVETLVLNQVHLQSVIASKAARLVEAARGRPVVDFGSRRAHGLDAALKVARASYIAGAAGTSNLLAGKRYAIPTFGTMAHSFVQVFDDELAAFRVFATLYSGTTLLVDTYDTLRGIERVIELAGRLGERLDVQAVRLDSGNLAELALAARAKLDSAGLDRIKIFVSSELDEQSIASLVRDRIPIDGFGVGTNLAVAPDAPALDMAYKLVEYDGVERTKLSSGKRLYPARKQVFRRSENGVFRGDTIGRFDETPAGEPLLVPVMKAGRRLSNVDLGLEAARRRARAQVFALTPELRSATDAAEAYPVHVSRGLENALERLEYAQAAKAGR